MRVKVGNQWFSAEPGNPIAVELTDQDKAIIATMPTDCALYRQFADRDVDNRLDALPFYWRAE